uniref:G protein-coupled receptor n=1 Tax=Pristionchus pacificus TaxID=54126 RepID=A0A8R1UXY7_PRIPA
MRPHLVRINSTITDQAPLVFNIILGEEHISLLEYTVFADSVVLYSSHRIAIILRRCIQRAIHRNFRCQVCSTSIIYLFGILARFLLIYYQIYNVPATDDDPILLVADLLRELVIGYYCGIPAAFCAQILIATVYWRWCGVSFISTHEYQLYERNGSSTFLVIVVTETLNITCAFINAAIWLLGYTPFIINISYLFIALFSSVSGMFISFTKNARQLVSLSTTNISHSSYTVGRSYQIRENILLMKYIVNIIVPAAIIASPCFICFAYNEYGPEDWLLSRSIAFAVWDLFFVIFRVCYLYREITMHPLILKEFKNLVINQILEMEVVRIIRITYYIRLRIMWYVLYEPVCVRVGQGLAQLKNLDCLKHCDLGLSRVLMTMGKFIIHVDVPMASDGVT